MSTLCIEYRPAERRFLSASYNGQALSEVAEVRLTRDGAKVFSVAGRNLLAPPTDPAQRAREVDILLGYADETPAEGAPAW